RPGHDVLHRGDHVQRVSGKALRSAASLEAHGGGRAAGPQVGARLLRVRGGKVTDFVAVATEDRIRTITVQRPEKLNALNTQVMEELDEAIGAAGSDPQLRCVIVTGAGDKAFIAGADIGELARLTPLEGREHARRGQRVVGRLERLKIPTIAAIN